MAKYLVEEFSGRYVAEETDDFIGITKDTILDRWYFLSLVFAENEEEAIKKAKELRK